MATIAVVKSGIEITLLASATSAEAMPRPNSAVPMGSPMASTEPKARMRMMTAAMMPRISLSGSTNSPNRSPPYSISRPSTVGLLVAEVLDLLAELGDLLEAPVGRRRAGRRRWCRPR